MKQNELMSRKHKKVYTTLVLTSTITGCISIFAFTSVIGIPLGITSFAIGSKICAITAGIKKIKSIIKKKKKHDKIVAKSKLNRIEVLINNVLEEDDEIKEQIKNS